MRHKHKYDTEMGGVGEKTEVIAQARRLQSIE